MMHDSSLKERSYIHSQNRKPDKAFLVMKQGLEETKLNFVKPSHLFDLCIRLLPLRLNYVTLYLVVLSPRAHRFDA